MKNLINLLFGHLLLPKEIISIFIWSAKLYLLALVPYLSFCTMIIIFCVLTGESFDFILFTRKYFYDGIILDFVTWRIHLAWFVICLIINIFKEFE